MDKRRYLDLIVLLMISVFVVSVSAGVYYSLEMTSTVDVVGANVYFVLGADNGTAGVSISGDGMVGQLTTLEAYPNATTTYDDPIRVRNNGTASYDIRLRNIDVSGDADYFVFVNFTLMGTTEVSLDYTTSGSNWVLPDPENTTWVSIPGDTEWSIKVETRAVAGASTGTATIIMTVDVTS
jgi:hypothetical protein